MLVPEYFLEAFRVPVMWNSSLANNAAHDVVVPQMSQQRLAD
jgi:hypothetical protein